MTFKKSLLIALLSFGIANTVLAETDTEKFDLAFQYHKQQNYTAAFPLFKELAEKGNLFAQFNLGVMYGVGQGVPQNDKQAFYWYQKAAEQGEAQAQYNLALMYNTGKGVEQDYKQAAYWYQKAAEQGIAQAQFNLGSFYYKGEGIRRDVQKAKHYYGLACDNGYERGCKAFAELDRQGVY